MTIYVWRSFPPGLLKDWPVEFRSQVKKVNKVFPKNQMVLIHPEGIYDLLDQANKSTRFKNGLNLGRLVLYMPPAVLYLVWDEYIWSLFSSIIPHGAWNELSEALCTRILGVDVHQLVLDSGPPELEGIKYFEEISPDDFPHLPPEWRGHFLECRGCKSIFLRSAVPQIKDFALGTRLLERMRKIIGDVHFEFPNNN